MALQPAIGDSDVIDGLNVWFLKLYGIWRAINLYRTTGKYSNIIRMHIFVSFFITIPPLIIQWQSIFVLEFNFQKAIFLYMHPLPALNLCCRILFLWFQMDKVCRLYDLMRKDFLNIPMELKEEVAELYKKTNKISNLCCAVLFLWNHGIEFWFIVFPKIPVDYIQHYTGSITAVTTGRKKILTGWYPVPMDKYPYYELIFVCEAIMLIYNATFLAVYYSLFYQVLTCLYAQYVVFGYRLSKIKLNFQNNNDLIINKDLHEIILEHQKLLRYTDELKSVYNPLVTMTLVIGVLVLIIGAVQILLEQTSDLSFIFQLVQIFSTQFIEVSLFCFGSSNIEKVSSDLQFAIYSSDWYKADLKFRRAAHMLMIRAKKGDTLMAFATFPVNLEVINKEAFEVTKARSSIYQLKITTNYRTGRPKPVVLKYNSLKEDRLKYFGCVMALDPSINQILQLIYSVAALMSSKAE